MVVPFYLQSRGRRLLFCSSVLNSGVVPVQYIVSQIVSQSVYSVIEKQFESFGMTSAGNKRSLCNRAGAGYRHTGGVWRVLQPSAQHRGIAK